MPASEALSCSGLRCPPVAVALAPDHRYDDSFVGLPIHSPAPGWMGEFGPRSLGRHPPCPPPIGRIPFTIQRICPICTSAIASALLTIRGQPLSGCWANLGCQLQTEEEHRPTVPPRSEAECVMKRLVNPFPCFPPSSNHTQSLHTSSLLSPGPSEANDTEPSFFAHREKRHAFSFLAPLVHSKRRFCTLSMSSFVRLSFHSTLNPVTYSFLGHTHTHTQTQKTNTQDSINKLTHTHAHTLTLGLYKPACTKWTNSILWLVGPKPWIKILPP
ncbi:unnamed protein product [Protopolystoma xenopodis]|uniref:Uncharacterized protein n=1 Tax=Protopolystoma xenopodis TaxID=117903 RepID=A0A448WNK4_9PLAT|nr:unnamed protein product [Protopolystoma xenopodis]